MKITWLGHASFLIEGNDRILVDPFVTGNPKAPVKPEDIKCDIICVTHGHGDHFGDAVNIAKNNDAPVVAIFEIARFCGSQEVNAVDMNVGGSVKIRSSTFTMTPAEHSSSIALNSGTMPGGCPAGFIIECGKTIYHAGDTSLMADMQWIGELYRPEIAMLPIGDRYTMGIKEGTLAAAWLKAKKVIPMHYDTFPPVEQDPRKYKESVEKSCTSEVVIMKPGEPVEF